MAEYKAYTFPFVILSVCLSLLKVLNNHKFKTNLKNIYTSSACLRTHFVYQAGHELTEIYLSVTFKCWD